MKVLVSDPITESGMSILQDAGLEVDYLPEGSIDEKRSACKDVHGWIIRSGTEISADFLEEADSLQVIGRAGVGVDNIDIPAATHKGVVVVNTPDVNTISAAEHTVALMLALSRNIPKGHRGMRKGQWNRHNLVGSELRNKTLGIVGLGKVGREVMKRCRAFNMKILGHDPYVTQDQFQLDEVEIVDLDALIEKADYITLHVPITDATRDLFDYEQLCKMKSSARIINVARGGIINEAGLVKALKDGKISGAAIDVYTTEPLDKNSPLVKAPNIVLTPHLGASTTEAKEGVSIAVCEQVRDYLLHEKLTNALNMPFADFGKLKEIQPTLSLAELLGRVQAQVVTGAIKSITLECYGTEEIKPISLAFLKSLLQTRVPNRINYINAESVAKELGIELTVQYSTMESNFSNLVSSRVVADTAIRFDGSVFGGNYPRLVNLFGHEMEVTPRGTMLFVENNDVPGVIGKVGTLLGDAGINIAAYLLSRKSHNGTAFAVIRLDSTIPNAILSSLGSLKEIQSVRQIEID
ncbi:MAG TPA: phosphoglycerate dehydrogenase [Candidatus Marinimicrobia bacterium]|nr:phosphoglycerate dehydrogenase [Candidatus Neomarinimicrobiota bacterium]